MTLHCSNREIIVATTEVFQNIANLYAIANWFQGHCTITWKLLGARTTARPLEMHDFNENTGAKAIFNKKIHKRAFFLSLYECEQKLIYR